jgi:putative endonuclease
MNILKVKTKNREIGDLGERRAVWHLIKKGYRILKTNYEANGAEIDIIARKKNITAFVEVKARNVKHLGRMEARPASAVTPEKQRKIIRLSNYFRRTHPFDGRMRFDIIEVYLEDGKKRPKIKEIKHLEAAFTLDTAYDESYYYKRRKEGSVL